LAPILRELTESEFQRRLELQRNGVLRSTWHVADYALTRLTQYNCCVIEGLDSPPWVLIGGFAIRHCYGGTRFSRDADLSFDSEMYVRGPVAIDPRMPNGFEIDEPGSTRNKSVNHLRVVYRRPWGKGAVWLHVNHRRPIKRPPAEVLEFRSAFVDGSFKVAIASINEIIADKLDGLVSSREDERPRAKDMWDLIHLFDLEVGIDPGAVRTLLPKRKGGTIRRVLEVLKLPAYRTAWEENVAELVDSPIDYDDACVRLLSHLARHFRAPGLTKKDLKIKKAPS
jgi:hypothetical protein